MSGEANDFEALRSIANKLSGTPVGNNLANILWAIEDFLSGPQDYEALYALAKKCNEASLALAEWAGYYHGVSN